MPQIEVLLPKMGESVAEATIIKWVKNEGDTIEADEAIIEIATDKVDSEVPAPDAGILIKKLCEEGDVIAVGQPIAIIDTGGDDRSKKTSPQAVQEIKPAAMQVIASNGHEKTEEPEPVGAENETLQRTGASGRFYSPLVRNIAQEEGIGARELEQIQGSGLEGRVTKKDILNYIPLRKTGGKPSDESSKSESTPLVSRTIQPAMPSAAIKSPQVSVGAEDEIVEMDRMRKLIAEHMVMSKHVSPHVTSYVEADVTNIVMWRNKWKDKFEKREGEKLTFTPIFLEAVAKALKQFPLVNVSTDGQNIIRRKHINIGMATALPSGNLIVPVIKDCDQLNLLGIAKKVNDLAHRARENKLKPEDIQGGTYTLTNVGTFGNVMGTPIINQPQAAIMAVGAIRKKPAVIETPQGDFIGIRHMMFLSHAYDHRIIDGALGGTFVRKVADFLEQFDINREI